MQNATTPEENPAPQESSNDGLKKKWNEMSVLAPLLAAYTILYLTLTSLDFLMKEKLELPEGMDIAYLALLGAYAADKEIRRWLGTPEPSRRGSVFVYLWFIVFAIFYVISLFEPSYKMPPYVLSISLQVLGIFFGTKASKQVYSWRVLQNDAKITTNEEKVMALLKEKGEITNNMVAELLGVSRYTAIRLLRNLKNAGKIEVIGSGSGRGVKYIIKN